MRPGWSTVKTICNYRGDVVHTALLEVFPALGIDVHYQSILNLVIDARASCSAAVPLESITVVINDLGNVRCEMVIQGYTRLDPGRPLDFTYPSNCADIYRALEVRLRSPIPIRPVSFWDQLRAQFGGGAQRKPRKLWLLVTVMFCGVVGYLLLT